jgi:hypothetical protein
MEKSSKIVAQVYGYAICLVAVITFLIATFALITAIIDLSDPLHSGWTPQGAPSIASYENYKLDVMKSYQNTSGTNKESILPDETSLKSMYDAAKNDRIQSSRRQATKTIMISSIMNLICVILFMTHWKWMQRVARSA